jgi:hypothetical protein
MESFRNYLENQKLNIKTIDKHVKNMTEYGKVGQSQKIMINHINDKPSTGTRLSLANSVSKYLQFKQEPNEEIVHHIKLLNEELQKESQQRQKSMSNDETLPTLKEMKAYMNSLYDKEDYKGYCILYLFITYQVRNMDMMATIVSSKKETNDTDNFFVVGRKQVTWIRNKYKTAFKYGTKTHVIRNDKFLTSIRTLSHLLKENENTDRVIKKITNGLGGITEATITKIVLKHNNTMNGLKRISKNRGTDVSTLIDSYNITN